MVCIIETVWGGAWPHDATKGGAVVEYSVAACQCMINNPHTRRADEL